MAEVKKTEIASTEDTEKTENKDTWQMDVTEFSDNGCLCNGN